MWGTSGDLGEGEALNVGEQASPHTTYNSFPQSWSQGVVSAQPAGAESLVPCFQWSSKEGHVQYSSTGSQYCYLWQAPREGQRSDMRKGGRVRSVKGVSSGDWGEGVGKRNKKGRSRLEGMGEKKKRPERKRKWWKRLKWKMTERCWEVGQKRKEKTTDGW